ncbi:chemokine-like receptor 1 [Clupea harengus]|uniref:Chemokine-like receptor 1 n=1 Tax=Clupea harengus TaxID=7950 RepID=A0A6P8FYA0_CLUHA|nr:chemokine-like receptor 1 [Clupea harengus]
MDPDFSMDYSMDLNEYDYSNYSTDNSTAEEEFSKTTQSTCFTDSTCITLVVINTVIFLLGVLGNGIVIWIAGFKMKKTVNTTWYLSLAVSDFLVCAIHPFNIAFVAMENWVFGPFLCKFTSFMMFVNMFSSIFLLVFISVDRCIAVVLPVWAQNHRTTRTASFVVTVAWIFSVVLSIPSIVFRDVQTHMGRTNCFNSYTSDPYSHTAIAVSRFVFGFIVPFIIIIVCYSVITLRLMSSQIKRSSKPLKIMTALIATFFICWLPYHVFILLELNHGFYDKRSMMHGLQFGTLLALANSCLNPVLYAFMGNDFRKKFRSSLLSKIENAMGEDVRTTSRYLSRNSSMDGRASTHI